MRKMLVANVVVQELGEKVVVLDDDAERCFSFTATPLTARHSWGRLYWTGKRWILE